MLPPHVEDKSLTGDVEPRTSRVDSTLGPDADAALKGNLLTGSTGAAGEADSSQVIPRSPGLGSPALGSPGGAQADPSATVPSTDSDSPVGSGAGGTPATNASSDDESELADRRSTDAGVQDASTRPSGALEGGLNDGRPDGNDPTDGGATDPNKRAANADADSADNSAVTAKIEVHSSPSEALMHVPNDVDTIDRSALERDADAELPPSGATQIVPADPRETVASAAETTASVADEPLGGQGASAEESPSPAKSVRPLRLARIPLAKDDASAAEGIDATSGNTGDGGAENAAFDRGSSTEVPNGSGNGSATGVASGTPLQSGSPDAEQERLAYIVGGRADAPTVVFLHGWCGRAEEWRAAMTAISDKYGIVAIDLPGHGRSKHVPRDEWSIPGCASDVVRVIRAEKLRDVVLVGHGMGGKVALEVAARIPKQIDAIVGVDCLQQLAGGPSKDNVQTYVDLFRNDFPKQMRDFVRAAVHEGASDALVDKITLDSLKVDSNVALALMEHFGVHDSREVTRNVQCRVVCINSAIVETDVEGNRVLLSSFDLNPMEGVGHWVHLEAPERFASKLDQTIAAVLTPPVPAGAHGLQSLMPMLVVADMRGTSDFYVNALGFKVALRTPREEAEPAILMTLERDGVSIVLQTRESFMSDFNGTEPPPAASSALFLKVANLDAELRRAGEDVRVAVSERNLDGGSRRIGLRDPEGNLVVLQESARVLKSGE